MKIARDMVQQLQGQGVTVLVVDDPLNFDQESIEALGNMTIEVERRVFEMDVTFESLKKPRPTKFRGKAKRQRDRRSR